MEHKFEIISKNMKNVFYDSILIHSDHYITYYFSMNFIMLLTLRIHLPTS